MVVIKEIVELLAELLCISVGQLPEDGGTVLQIAPSSGTTRFLDGSAHRKLQLLILSKQTDQQTALENAEQAQRNAVALSAQSIENGRWQITGIECTTEPGYVTKEGDFWIYSTVISVSYYDKEGF